MENLKNKLTKENLVQLKAVKYSEWASEETYCYEANIYFKGHLVGYCKNDGRGGETYVTNHNDNLGYYFEFINYCKSMPPRVYDFGTFKTTSNDICDYLLEIYLEEKDNKKIKKLFINNIVYELKGATRTIFWENNRKKIPLLDLINTNPNLIINEINQLKKEGANILNDNINLKGI